MICQLFYKELGKKSTSLNQNQIGGWLGGHQFWPLLQPIKIDFHPYLPLLGSPVTHSIYRNIQKLIYNKQLRTAEYKE